jgi:hypothetical protein
VFLSWVILVGLDGTMRVHVLRLIGSDSTCAEHVLWETKSGWRRMFILKKAVLGVCLIVF